MLRNVSRRQEFVIVAGMALVIMVVCLSLSRLYVQYGEPIATETPIAPTSTGCTTPVFVVTGHDGEDHTILYCVGDEQCYSEQGWEAYTSHRFDVHVSYSTVQCVDDVFTISISMNDGSVHLTNDLFETWHVLTPDEAVHQPPWGHFWYSRAEHCTRCPDDCASDVVSATCVGAQYAVVNGMLVEYTTRTGTGLIATHLDDLVYLGFGREANEYDLYRGE